MRFIYPARLHRTASDADTVASIDDLLREVSPDLRLKR
jgi:hypothetical protein